MGKRKLNTVRISAGEFHGRVLVYPQERVLRPTMSRTRESVMDTLGPLLNRAEFVDLFAAGGSVGIEALSRGARAIRFVECSPVALDHLKRNLAALRLDDGARCSVVRGDVADFLRDGGAADATLVYADPPYGTELAQAVLAHFDENPYPELQRLLIEHGGDLDTRSLRRLRVHKEKRFGKTVVTFLALLKEEAS